MWNETKSDITRREIRTTKRFDQVVTAIEARAPVVIQETNQMMLGRDAVEAINSCRIGCNSRRMGCENRSKTSLVPAVSSS
jgi:hypothetical protein